MRELMLGMVVVGLVVGIIIGRNTEKSRRSFADRTSAKATYDKYRKAVRVDTTRAAITFLIVGAFALAILVGWINYPN